MNDGEIFILVMVIFVIIGILIHIWFFSAIKKPQKAAEEHNYKKYCRSCARLDRIWALLLMWYLFAVFFGIIGIIGLLAAL